MAHKKGCPFDGTENQRRLEELTRRLGHEPTVQDVLDAIGGKVVGVDLPKGESQAWLRTVTPKGSGPQ